MVGDSATGGTHVKQRYMLSVMCGRSTYRLTWEEIVRLYRLTLDQPAQNTRARYDVCPTTTIDTITESDGNRRLVPMRKRPSAFEYEVIGFGSVTVMSALSHSKISSLLK
jgi:hypothetical protein